VLTAQSVSRIILPITVSVKSSLITVPSKLLYASYAPMNLCRRYISPYEAPQESWLLQVCAAIKPVPRFRKCTLHCAATERLRNLPFKA
jgi:hypothetical protein